MRSIDAKKHHPEVAVVPTLEGMVAGAVAGAIAGPVGIAVGASLGGLIGAAAGEALEDATDEAELRDEELDEEIGVASGDLGAHEAAASGLRSMLASARTRDDLLQAHAEMERDLASFRHDLAQTDTRGLVAHFARFEDRTRAHLRHEEADILPELAKEHPREVEELLAEHDLLRKELDDLAIAIQLHSANPQDITALFDALAAHGRNEERVFTLWADR
jgi:hypothetical protein